VAIRLSVRLLVALACVAGVAVSVISRDSRLEAEKAQVYYGTTGDKQGAIQRIHDARRLNPSYPLDIAEARLLAPAAGVALLERSTHREPQNAELWLALSQEQVRAGDRSGAARSYERARALAPAFLAPAGRRGS
jgi:predicted Zn-dependent protease